jgi:hypothetical protein
MKAAPAEPAIAFSSIVGGMFRSAHHDARLSANENWKIFLGAMYPKMETLTNLGFDYDSALRSRLFTSEERAFVSCPYQASDRLGWPFIRESTASPVLFRIVSRRFDADASVRWVT